VLDVLVELEAERALRSSMTQNRIAPLVA